MAITEADVKDIARTCIAEFRRDDEERFGLKMSIHEKDEKAHEAAFNHHKGGCKGSKVGWLLFLLGGGVMTGLMYLGVAAVQHWLHWAG